MVVDEEGMDGWMRGTLLHCNPSNADATFTHSTTPQQEWYVTVFFRPDPPRPYCPAVAAPPPPVHGATHLPLLLLALRWPLRPQADSWRQPDDEEQGGPHL